MSHTYCSIPMPLPNIIKMSKGIKVMECTRFWLQGDNYIMKKKVRVVSLACDMPTGPPLHPYQIFIKLFQTVWELWPAQDFGFRGDNYIRKTVRAVSCMQHAYGSSSTFLPNIINKGIKVMERTRMRLRFLLQGK